MSDRSKRQPQHRPGLRGFTLVEFMVAIAISLFITAGMSTLFLYLRQTFNAQNNLGQLQDSQRLVATMISNTVENAGYFVDPVNTTLLTEMVPGAFANPDGTTFAQGQFVLGTTGPTGNPGDTLDVRFETTVGDGILNCQGAGASTGTTLWYNSLAVSNYQLTCALNNTPAVPLVDNVYNMKILYGVDVGGNGNPDTYLDAKTISGASLWGSVRTARVTITFVDTVNSTGSKIVALPLPWVQTVKLMNVL